MMRAPLLDRNPELGPVTLSLLVGVANAIEREAVQRYEMLADIMERRGETATAEAFRTMLAEEREHVATVERWAASLGEPIPDTTQFEWRLPQDLSKSWHEVSRSARLTPYRAFAIAVDNEQRAFALYSYLAADATDPKVAAQAERLAVEELQHASRMRRHRRQAWHRERRVAGEAQPAIVSASMLHALLARHESAIVACHRAIAEKLRALGDAESAQLLEQLAATPTRAPDPAATSAYTAPVSANPVHLLTAAQAPLEALSETLEAAMRTTEGELFAEVEKALANVIARLSRISLQTERRMQAEGVARR